MLQNKIKIIAISGSLRANSSNEKILQVIATMISEKVDFFTYKGIAALPHFDDADPVPIPVAVFRKHLQEADAVLICTPEYAFGVPGSLKNALDWTVGSGELVDKPLALITASTGGEKAHAQFLQIFAALSAKIPNGGDLLISYVRSKLDAAGGISDAPTLKAVQSVLDKLILAVEEKTTGKA
ncbi:MAG: NAD(P)H-dependent oxidoreductase [Chitinophagaceae bacterium]